MKCILDTHFLIWITTDHPRLDQYGGLDALRPWGVSPVSLLELQFLAEVGRLSVDVPRFREALASDPRLVLDDPSLVALVDQSLALDWTRDPFDRLLAAHSAARRVPLVTADRQMLEHHRTAVEPV